MEYEVFYDTFLAEMPWHVPGGNYFAAQAEMLHELISDGYDVNGVEPNIFKIAVGDQITYWYGSVDAENISIIVDTEVHGKFCKVTLTSKNPKLSAATAPYASDLYAAIKQDLSNDSLVFTSDSVMSDDAIRLWARLHNSGHIISVFDASTNQYVLNKVTNADDLKSFLGGPDKQRFIFVLSESQEQFTGTRHAIGLMELKRKAGYPIFEHLKAKKK